MRKSTGMLSLLIWALCFPVMAAAEEQGGITNVLEALGKQKIEPQQAWKTTPLLVGPNCTLNLAQLNLVVKSHYHQTHDEIVYIVRGNGLVTIGEQEYQVWPGYAYLVPQGTVHRFVNLGPDAAVVLSIFSPAFDGKDRVFVEE